MEQEKFRKTINKIKISCRYTFSSLLLSVTPIQYLFPRVYIYTLYKKQSIFHGTILSYLSTDESSGGEQIQINYQIIFIYLGFNCDLSHSKNPSSFSYFHFKSDHQQMQYLVSQNFQQDDSLSFRIVQDIQLECSSLIAINQQRYYCRQQSLKLLSLYLV